MLLRRIITGVLGMSFGLMTAGGVFTVLLAVGLIPRFAGKTHTGRRVMLYETMVILGTMAGDIMSVFGPQIGLAALEAGIPETFWRILGQSVVLCYGLFAGSLSAAWPWPSQRCWTVFLSLPEGSASGMGLA